MKKENRSKRLKTPYIAMTIVSIIFAIAFTVYSFVLNYQNDLKFAIYAMVLGCVWYILFGIYICLHFVFLRDKRQYEQAIQDFEEIKKRLEKELEEEPFEDFKENKYRIDE